MYACGTGLANMILSPFLLQYALGDIRLQVKSYVVIGSLWIPAAIWSTYCYGAWGAGLAWLIGCAVLLSVCWTLAHRCHLSKGERKGMHASIFMQAALLGALAAVLPTISPAAVGSRIGAMIFLSLVVGAFLLVGILGSGDLRAFCFRWYSRPRAVG
jgi:hypothetical protein